MTFTTHVIGSDHIENWDPPCTSLFSARLTFPFFTMPLRARPVHPPVDLPDPEADLASNAAETTELPFEDLTDELHESENEEVECETPLPQAVTTPQTRPMPMVDRHCLGLWPRKRNLRLFPLTQSCYPACLLIFWNPVMYLLTTTTQNSSLTGKLPVVRQQHHR